MIKKPAWDEEDDPFEQRESQTEDEPDPRDHEQQQQQGDHPLRPESEQSECPYAVAMRKRGIKPYAAVPPREPESPSEPHEAKRGAKRIGIEFVSAGIEGGSTDRGIEVTLARDENKKVEHNLSFSLNRMRQAVDHSKSHPEGSPQGWAVQGSSGTAASPDLRRVNRASHDTFEHSNNHPGGCSQGWACQGSSGCARVSFSPLVVLNICMVMARNCHPEGCSQGWTNQGSSGLLWRRGHC